MSVDDEALLRGLVLGDVDPYAPDVRARLDADPALRARYEEARGVLSALDEAGRLERADLAGAERRAGAPGEAAVAGLVRRQALSAHGAADAARRADVGSDLGAAGPGAGAGTGDAVHVDVASPSAAPRPRASALRRVSIAAAAVAAGLLLLVAVAGWPPFGGDQPARERLLGGAPLELLEPVGRVDAFERFRWSDPARKGDTYTLRVYAADGDEPAALWSASGLRELELDAPAEETRGWPSEIRWEVVPYDASGRAGVASEARARSSD